MLIVALCTTEGFTQQLRLGISSTANIKSAVLELQSTNQGLLFTRIADTALINTLNPPDGMVVYFTPAKRLLLRASGAWQALASTTSIDTTNIPNFYLKVRNELSGGTGINYNNVTGVISNAGVTSLNGNTGALTMDTGYIPNFYQKVRGLFSAVAPITLSNGQIGITQATTSTNGYLSSTDWNTFNNKLSSIDTTNISNFYLKVRSRLSAGTGISYNNTTGVISNGGVTTLNGNTGALTMDTGYISNFYQKVRGLFSAGSGITYNSTTGVITAGGAGTNWALGGNTVGALKTIGTVDNYDLPFITNNTERMRISSTGNVGIGTATFDGTYPEKLLVHAGTTSSFNLINAKGAINNYLQLNIQNLSSGNTASSDVVATADNGSETTNFIDMGINSSSYGSTGILGGANNAYLYSAGNDFVIGNQTGNKNLIFFTGGSNAANERMRIDGYGRVGIGVTNATNPLVVKDTFEIRRTGTLSALLFTNTAGAGDFRIGGDGGDIFWQGGGGRNLQMGSYWTTVLMGDRQSSSFPALSSFTTLNTGVLIPAQRDASVPLAIQANSATQSANLTEWRNASGTVMDMVDETGSIAVGTSSFDASNPEKLLVDAGATSSFNVISGKGAINNYLQLNIQNRSSGTGASSDVVATADNGSETANFIDMGINSSQYTTSGMLGGADNAYLYSTGNDFVIGNSTSAKNLRFFTGGTATANERVRIDGNGKVGINTTTPAATLDVAGTYKLGSSGTALSNMIKTTFSITDNGAFGLGTTKVITATVSGATTGASVILNPRSQLPTAVAIAYSYVSSANTITIGFVCSQGVLSTSTLGTINFDVTVIQ
ncbi:hypothetical protein Niako_5008 [Niastella koreensis GR20-10]|uniref:Uncharacterized protein n=2 Tax=Niastella koreensis TaxID=354356 RepID=G8T8R7_NIAKG|nr:hypothetical protein Niako_5008 [Niastella koreensis GR20-10]